MRVSYIVKLSAFLRNRLNHNAWVFRLSAPEFPENDTSTTGLQHIKMYLFKFYIQQDNSSDKWVKAKHCRIDLIP